MTLNYRVCRNRRPNSPSSIQRLLLARFPPQRPLASVESIRSRHCPSFTVVERFRPLRAVFYCPYLHHRLRPLHAAAPTRPLIPKSPLPKASHQGCAYGAPLSHPAAPGQYQPMSRSCVTTHAWTALRRAVSCSGGAHAVPWVRGRSRA